MPNSLISSELRPASISSFGNEKTSLHIINDNIMNKDNGNNDNIVNKDNGNNIEIDSDFDDNTSEISDSETISESCDVVNENEIKKLRRENSMRNKKLQEIIDKELLKSDTPEAKRLRRLLLLKTSYGDFMCSLCYYTPIYAGIIGMTLNNFDKDLVKFSSAFISGFQAVAVCFAFSSMSGAHFNSAVCFALWGTNKIGKRKLFLYISVNFLASIIGMAMCYLMFSQHDVVAFNDAVMATTHTPLNDSTHLRVFFSEFAMTFILVYVSFTAAFEEVENKKIDNLSVKALQLFHGLTLYTPTKVQKNSGFSPFVIGLTIFSLSQVASVSGGCFNPGAYFSLNILNLLFLILIFFIIL
jgi:glycerol uptake facilitator-like aquaporin